MKNNQIIKNKFELILKQIELISDITVVERKDSCAKIVINNHKPLNDVEVGYYKRNYFWTANFLLAWSVKIPFDMVDYKIVLKYKKDVGYFETNNVMLGTVTDKLNSIELLKKRLSAIDVETFEIIGKNGITEIKMFTFAGTSVSTLIPPMTYQVPIKTSEIIMILEVFQLILATIQERGCEMILQK